MKIENVIVDCQLRDDLGKYDISFHDNSIVFEGKPYKYFSSGLCRTVWVCPDRKNVIKIPIADYWEMEEDGAMDCISAGDFSSYKIPLSVRHNLLEAKAYKDAPQKFKRYLARTKMLKHGWLLQEFCNVYQIYAGLHFLRELGKTMDGRHVVFDYDPFFKDWSEPTRGFYYEWLPDFIKKHKIK